MLDNRELKKLLVVVLGIVVLLGVFVGVRSCDKANDNEVIQEDINNSTDDEDNNDINVEYEDKEDTEDEVSNNDEGSKNNNTTVEVETPVVPDVEQVVQKEPVVTMKENYIVNVNNSFVVPVVSVDDNGEAVTTEISYEFLPLDSLNYVSVMNIDTSRLGTYKVTYKISNEYKTIVKVVYVEIVDNELPTVTANQLVYEEVEGEIVETAIPVLDGSYINDNVYFAFSDNDKIAYAEYYKAIKEIVNGEETIEKEAMANVTEIKLDEPFFLIEDGEYHIRVVDRSGNTTEFVVTIDKTPSVLEEKTIVQDGDVTVTLTFDEKIKEVEGWTLSEDMKTLTKVYDSNKTEDITVEDLAGNTIPVTVEVVKTIDLNQDNVSVRNEQNISTDGGKDLTLTINAKKDGELEVNTPNGASMISIPAGTSTFDFVNNGLFDTYGDYSFTFTDSEGNVSTFSVTISQLLIED